MKDSLNIAYPEWVNTLSKNHGVSVEEVLSLYNTNSDFNEVKAILDTEHPISSREFTDDDLWNLTFEKNVSFGDAIKTYDLAARYKKDPLFIADLFIKDNDWEKIEEALKRYMAFERNTTNNSNLTKSLSKIYGCDLSNTIETMKNSGADADHIRSIIFFMDLNSKLEGASDLSFATGLDSNWKASLPVGINDMLSSQAKAENVSLNSSSSMPMIQSSSNHTPGSVESTFTISNTASTLETSSPFNQYFKNTVELIDPRTGGLMIQQTDFSLPGKNGMDFSLTRLFQNTDNNLQSPYITGYWDTEWVTEWVEELDENGDVIGEYEVDVEVEYIRYEATTRQRSYSNIFGLPFGWTLDGIPILTEISSKGANANLGSKGIFALTFSASSSKRKDLILTKNTSYFFDGVTSAYALRRLSGTTWYFNSSGYPIACKNKFGECIRFIYTGSRISKIIDTVGRVVKFTHNTSLPSLVIDVYESIEEDNLLQTWSYDFGTTSLGHKTLLKVHPPLGQDIEFEYEEATGRYSHYEYGSCNLKHLNLKSVTHPTSGVTNFTYVSSTNRAYMPIFKIQQRWDNVPTQIVNSDGTITDSIDMYANMAKYSYTGDYYSATTMTKKTYMGNSDILINEEYWAYNAYADITMHRITAENMGDDKNKKEVIETKYTYCEISKLPTLISNKTTLYYPNGTIAGESPEIVKSQRYDEYDNVTTVVDSLGNKSEFSYDKEFNMLTSKKEYFSQSNEENTYRLTEYTLDEIGRVVEKVTTVMEKETLTDIISYKMPFISVQKNPNTYTWQSPTKLQKVFLKIKASTGGWWSDSKYKIEYRKLGYVDWIVAYEAPLVTGGLISDFTYKDLTINFPEIAHYEIRVFNVVDGNNYVQILADDSSNISLAYKPDYEVTQISPAKCKRYEYDDNNPGNVIAVNKYPFGQSDGTPDSRVEITYDPQWNYAFPNVKSINVTAVDGTTSVVQTIKEYDELGRITKIRKEETEVIPYEMSYEYDDFGRVTKLINPSLDNETDNSFKEAVYDDIARQVTSIDELGNQKRVTYDALGRVLYSEWKDTNDVWHLVSSIRYDLRGRREYIFDANFNSTNFQYDNLGRKMKTTFADASSIEKWHVDINMDLNVEPSISLSSPSGFNNLELSSWKKIINQEGNPTYVGYDVLGRIIWRATNPKGEYHQETPMWDMIWYEYDIFNRLTKEAINRTSSEWDVTEYEYEGTNNMSPSSLPLSMKLPGDVEPKYIYEYNSRGLKTKEYQINDPLYATTVDYDELGRVKRINYPDSAEKEEFYYSIYGITRGESLKNDILENAVNINYNQRGWLNKKSWEIDGSTYEFQFIYDESGNKTSMIYPDDTEVDYVYDELHRIKNIPGYFENDTDDGFEYDAVGNLTDIWAINGVHSEYAYNDLNMVISMSSNPLSLAYTYDKTGNITSIIDSANYREPVISNYAYDARGQLKSAQINSPEKMERFRYNYDGVGNRIYENYSMIENIPSNYIVQIGKKINETWGNLDQFFDEYTYEYLPGNYLASRIGLRETDYTWDSHGQLASKSTGESYTFNSKKQLSKVMKGENVIETYTYDPMGRRLKVENGEKVTLNLSLGNVSVYEIKKNLITDDITKTRYISTNGKYLAKIVQENGGDEQKYFHHVDLIGSVRAITGLSGDISASYEYEPFGARTIVAGEDQDNIGFGGKRSDDTKLSYFGARYYDAEIGRFISRDPIRSGRNWFIYCINNPLIYTDPTGMEPTFTGGYGSKETPYPVIDAVLADLASQVHNKVDSYEPYVGAIELVESLNYVLEYRGSSSIKSAVTSLESDNVIVVTLPVATEGFVTETGKYVDIGTQLVHEVMQHAVDIATGVAAKDEKGDLILYDKAAEENAMKNIEPGINQFLGIDPSQNRTEDEDYKYSYSKPDEDAQRILKEAMDLDFTIVDSETKDLGGVKVTAYFNSKRDVVTTEYEYDF